MNKYLTNQGVVYTPLLILLAVMGLIAYFVVTNAPFKDTVLETLYPKHPIHAAFTAPSPFPGCPQGTTTPTGQSNPSIEYEPMGGIWCFPLVQSPTTRIAGVNDWVDEFNTNVQMGTFGKTNSPNGNDAGNRFFNYTETTDMDYYIVNNSTTNAGKGQLKTQGFMNANHWMFDLSGANIEGGTLISPKKSFKWENGKLIVETDVAASIPEYGPAGADRFVEIDINTSPVVTIGKTAASLGIDCGDNVQQGVCWPPDILYGYGEFPGHWSFGCRLEPSRNPVCALYHPHGDAGDPNQFGNGLGRVWESNPTEVGAAWNSWTVPNYPSNGGNLWRKCPVNEMDIFCRDRFRLEITKTSLTLYVNGGKYYEITMKPGASILHLPAGQLFPNEIINGDNYVYYTTWVSAFNDKSLIRFHWDRLAVNPHDLPGHIQPPTQAPSFCPGQPGNSCPMIMTEDPSLPAIARNTVDILDFVFAPGDVTVEAGTTVTWTNKSLSGVSHSVVSDQVGLFDSGSFGPGQTYARAFNTPGVYTYYCGPHPSMKGKVTVYPAGGSPMPSMSPLVTARPSSSANPSATPGQTMNRTVTLTGSQEVPSNNSSATGTAQVTINTGANTLSYNLSYSGLSSTEISSHIHGFTGPGVSSGILHNLPTSNPKVGTWNYSEDQEANILAGLTYMNIHTTNFPNGEIRGQIGSGTNTPVPTPVVTSPPGTITVIFDDASGQNQALNGQYPTGVIEWGNGNWFLSSPFGQLTTKNLTFNGVGITSASFSLLTPRRLVSLQAYNGGITTSTVTLACTGQTTRTFTLAANTLQTLTTNWTGSCGSIILSSSNGWDTNFDNLVLSGTATTPPTSIPTTGGSRWEWNRQYL